MTTPHSALHTPHFSPPRPVIGLLGGIGAGKSLIASQFAQLGCAVVDADGIAHLLLTEAPIQEAIRRRFGDAVFEPSGAVSRQALGKQVFASRADLQILEGIVHPELWRRVRKAVAKARMKDVPAVVLDAALILEKKLDTLCNIMVYISAPEDVRLERARKARGWDPPEVARREASQISLKTKQARADYIIDNRTSPEHALQQIRGILLRIGK